MTNLELRNMNKAELTELRRNIDKILAERPTRTDQQNRALHLWLKQKCNQCMESGITPKMTFAKTIDIEMTPQMMKEIWRAVQRVMYKKESTTELLKTEGEFENITEHLNRFFAEQFGLDAIPFPSIENMENEVKI